MYQSDLTKQLLIFSIFKNSDNSLLTIPASGIDALHNKTIGTYNTQERRTDGPEHVPFCSTFLEQIF